MLKFVKAAPTPPKHQTIRLAERLPDEVAWRQIERIVRRKYPLYRRAILNAWDKWRGDIDIEALFDSLLASNTDQALFVVQRPWVAAMNAALPEVQRIMAETVAESARLSIKQIESQVAQATGQSLSVQFGGPASREVQNYITREAGRLITRIGETERAAIRELLLDGVRSSRTPTQVAQDIRQFIGVTHPQAQTLMRLRETMQAAGIPAHRIQERIEARTRKMIRQRARQISLNESLMASKQGQRVAYMQSAEQGLIDLSTARRFWMVGGGEKTCEISLMTPHAHVRCRCVERLVL
jgi:hypothetical protein